MKTARKALAIALCAILLVGASVMGTLAYLTSTDEVTNTFTVGNVKITLDEAPVDANGKEIAGTRVRANNYKLLPGHEYDKDPTIHVDANSEDCWLFVTVDNQIAPIEADTTVADQMTANGWVTVADGVYGREATNKAGDNVVVFETVKVLGTVDNTTLAGYANKTVVVKAYAIQADGFQTAAAAWEATGDEAQTQTQG